ncbi:MAG: YidH family protein [Gemmataceae bacterium]
MTDLAHDNSNRANAPPEPAVRLAFEQLYLAHERTQLAWVQVSLALITFGFTIAKVVEALPEKGGERATHVSASTVGMLMIVFGLVTLGVATLQHHRYVKLLRLQCPGLPLSQSSVLSIMLAVLGVVAFVGVLLRD